MQITEKLELQYQTEINQLAEIQVQQGKSFDQPVDVQHKFLSTAFQKVHDQSFNHDQFDLIQKIELTELLFDVHLHAYVLPKVFSQHFESLKIIVLKCALYHSAFFINPENPITQFLSLNSHYIKNNLCKQNQAQYLALLKKEIHALIINFQSDPHLFLAHSNKLLTSLQHSAAVKKSAITAKKLLKTSTMKDDFSRVMSHDKITTLDKTAKLNIQIAKNLIKGDWLEFKASSKTSLIKLIWKADDNSEFIFVNKEGEKVKQCTLLELATDFEKNIVSTLSKSNHSAKRNISTLKTIG